MVVVETTWQFRNLRKLRTETRTVNKCSGSGVSSATPSSGLLSCAVKRFNTIGCWGEKTGILFGFVQSFHSVSTLTPSVLIDSFRQPLLFARMARTSDMGLSLSTTVLNFCNGGNRICNYNSNHAHQPNRNSRARRTNVRFRTQRFTKPLHVGRAHHLYPHVMRNMHLPPDACQAVDFER